jgi:hypothetical protein
MMKRRPALRGEKLPRVQSSVSQPASSSESNAANANLLKGRTSTTGSGTGTDATTPSASTLLDAANTSVESIESVHETDAMEAGGGFAAPTVAPKGLASGDAPTAPEAPDTDAIQQRATALQAQLSDNQRDLTWRRGELAFAEDDLASVQTHVNTHQHGVAARQQEIADAQASGKEVPGPADDKEVQEHQRKLGHQLLDLKDADESHGRLTILIEDGEAKEESDQASLKSASDEMQAAASAQGAAPTAPAAASPSKGGAPPPSAGSGPGPSDKAPAVDEPAMAQQVQSQVQSQVDQATAEADSVVAELSQIDGELMTKQSELAAAKAATASNQQELQTTRGSLSDATSSLSARKRSLANTKVEEGEAKPSPESDAQVQRFKSEIARLKGKVTSLESQASSLAASEASMAQAVVSIEAKQAETKAKRAEVEGKRQGLMADLAAAGGDFRGIASKLGITVADIPNPVVALVVPIAGPSAPDEVAPVDAEAEKQPVDASQVDPKEVIETVAKVEKDIADQAAAPPPEVISEERKQQLAEKASAFHKGTNTLLHADGDGVVDTLKDLKTPGEAQAFLNAYNKQFCADGSDKEPLTMGGLEQRMADKMAPGDFMVAKAYLKGDPEAGMTAHLRKLTGDADFNVEADVEASKARSLNGNLASSVYDFTDFRILDDIQGKGGAVFENVQEDELIKLAESDPETFQKVMAKQPEMRSRIDESMVGEGTTGAKWDILKNNGGASTKDLNTKLDAVRLDEKLHGSGRLFDLKTAAGFMEDHLGVNLDSDKDAAAALLDKYKDDPQGYADMAEQYALSKGEAPESGLDFMEAEVKDEAKQRDWDVFDTLMVGQHLVEATVEKVVGPIHGANDTLNKDATKAGAESFDAKLERNRAGVDLNQTAMALNIDPNIDTETLENAIAAAKNGPIPVPPERQAQFDHLLGLKQRKDDADLKDQAARATQALADGKVDSDGGFLDVMKDAKYEKRRADLEKDIGKTKDPAVKARYEAELATVETKQKEKRAKIDAHVRASTGKSMGELIDEKLGSVHTLKTGGRNDASFAKTMWEQGQLPPEDNFYVAIRGAGSNKERATDVFKGKSPQECEAICDRIKAKYGGEAFSSNMDLLANNATFGAYGAAQEDNSELSSKEFVQRMIASDFGGRDQHDLEIAVMGDPTEVYSPDMALNPDKKKEAIAARLKLEKEIRDKKYGFERDSGLIGKSEMEALDKGSDLLGIRDASGELLDFQHNRVAAFEEENRALLEAGDQAAWKEYDQLNGYQDDAGAEQAMYRDSVTDAVVLGVEITGVLVATIASGGGASPLLVAAITSIYGGGALGAEWLMKGDQMDEDVALQKGGRILLTLALAGGGQLLKKVDKGILALGKVAISSSLGKLSDGDAWRSDDILNELVAQVGLDGAKVLLSQFADKAVGAHVPKGATQTDASAFAGGYEAGKSFAIGVGTDKRTYNGELGVADLLNHGKNAGLDGIQGAGDRYGDLSRRIDTIDKDGGYDPKKHGSPAEWSPEEQRKLLEGGTVSKKDFKQAGVELPGPRTNRDAEPDEDAKTTEFDKAKRHELEGKASKVADAEIPDVDPRVFRNGDEPPSLEELVNAENKRLDDRVTDDRYASHGQVAKQPTPDDDVPSLKELTKAASDQIDAKTDDRYASHDDVADLLTPKTHGPDDIAALAASGGSSGDSEVDYSHIPRPAEDSPEARAAFVDQIVADHLAIRDPDQPGLARNGVSQETYDDMRSKLLSAYDPAQAPGSSLTIHNGSMEDGRFPDGQAVDGHREAALIDLARISQTPGGRELIGGLADGDKPTTIHSLTGDTGGDAPTNALYARNDDVGAVSYVPGKDLNSGHGPQRSDVVAFHELKHAYDDQYGEFSADNTPHRVGLDVEYSGHLPDREYEAVGLGDYGHQAPDASTGQLLTREGELGAKPTENRYRQQRKHVGTVDGDDTLPQRESYVAHSQLFQEEVYEAHRGRGKALQPSDQGFRAQVEAMLEQGIITPEMAEDLLS